MADQGSSGADKTAVEQTVISKKGAVMKVTRPSLLAKARTLLRSNSSGIVTRRDEKTGPSQEATAHA